MGLNDFQSLIDTCIRPQLSGLSYSSGGAVDRYESIYAALSRFALANSLSKRELVGLFKAGMLRDFSRSKDLGNIGIINTEQMMSCLAISKSQLDEMFWSWRSKFKDSICCPYFRYCSICASAHRHYTVFQAEGLIKCPFHSLPLKDCCDYCGKSMCYEWSGPLLSHPFRCAYCMEPLGSRQGKIVFFDLHTITRAHRMAWANGQRNLGKTLNYSPLEGCPGYIVCGSRSGDFDQWCAMANLPLHGREWNDRNWSSCAGYIQIRGPRVKSLGKRGLANNGSIDPEITTYLMQCMKSILRHLRKSWHIKNLPYNPPEAFQTRRQEAYNLLLRHWCGSSSNLRVSDRREGPKHSISVITMWLRSAVNSADAYAVPSSVTTWFLAHRFCNWVVESIATVARMIDRPPSIPDSCLLEQIQCPQKPLWLLAFIEPASYISYRVLHYYHYSACLSSEEDWFGSSDEKGSRLTLMPICGSCF